MRYRITGQKYFDGALVALRKMQADAPLVLVRDPKNETDRFAIKIVDGKTGKQLGWIPAGDNRPLAEHMDAIGHDKRAATFVPSAGHGTLDSVETDDWKGA